MSSDEHFQRVDIMRFDKPEGGTRLRQFRLFDRNSLRTVQCDDLPAVMVVAGPNGSGKSTLLYEIKKLSDRFTANIAFIYVSAHRVWRAQSIRAMHLLQNKPPLSEWFSNDRIEQPEGLRIVDRNSPLNMPDDSISMTKFTLAHFEFRKRAVIASLVERARTQEAEKLVRSLYQPFERLISFFLPHLSFQKVNMDNNEQVYCHLLDNRSRAVIDIDQLSSGEKAVFALLMPFIEDEMNNILAEYDELQYKSREGRVIIIDEPELHLHSALQLKFLLYIREQSVLGKTQFIIATHSHVIIDNALAEELYTLVPPTNNLDNQLIQLLDSNEKLRELRAICGSTIAFTTSKNIVCIEGAEPGAHITVTTDQQILGLLLPEFTNVVLLPVGGKREVISFSQKLREFIAKSLHGVRVVSLTDRDTFQDGMDTSEHHCSLNVCNIENLLLNAKAIYKVLEPWREKIQMPGEAAVEQKLRQIANSRMEEEIRIRVLRRLKPVKLYPTSSSIKNIASELRERAEKVLGEDFAECKIRETIKLATEEVAKVVENNTTLEYFNGKKILRSFFGEVISSNVKIGFEEFKILIARQLGEDPIWQQAFRTQVQHILI